MTKEEIIEKISPELKDWLNACGYDVLDQEAIVGVVKVIDAFEREKIALSEGLEEAAEEILSEKYPQLHNGSLLTEREMMELIKAGAELMAGQGNSIECDIEWYDGPFLGITEEQMLDATKDFKVGDKVIVQIRKNIDNEKE